MTKDVKLGLIWVLGFMISTKVRKLFKKGYIFFFYKFSCLNNLKSDLKCLWACSLSYCRCIMHCKEWSKFSILTEVSVFFPVLIIILFPLLYFSSVLSLKLTPSLVDIIHTWDGVKVSVKFSLVSWEKKLKSKALRAMLYSPVSHIILLFYCTFL